MKALLSLEPGGPETLRLAEVPDPIPQPDQIVVRVKTCGVNYPDGLMIEDRYQEKIPRPFAPGGEVGGIVESVGAQVTAFRPDDPVVALTFFGGMAEKIAVSAGNAWKIPVGGSFAESAVLLSTYSTSYYALVDRARLQTGERLLVLGASGGVGLAAVELGKALGAQVVAAVSSEEKAAVAKQAGADHTVIYPANELTAEQQRELTKQFRAAFGGKNANVVYDPVGGSYTEAALRATDWEGRHLIVGFTAGIPRIPTNLPLLKGCSIVGVIMGTFAARQPEAYRRNLNRLFELFNAGKIRPLISGRLPLERGGEAIAKLRDRRAVGKIVVTIGGP